MKKIIKNETGSSDFPLATSPFKSKVAVKKNLSKKDYHCHLTMGASSKQIALIIKNSDTHDFNQIKEKISKHSLRGIRLFIVVFLLHMPRIFINSVFILNVIIRFSGILRNWSTGNCYMVSKEILKETVKQVSKNYLSDNVTSFSLRLNPFKENMYKKDTDIFSVFIETLSCIIESLDSVAKARGIDKNSLTVILSLNRDSGKKYLAYMKEINKRKPEIPKFIMDRIYGIDLAGPEGNIDGISVDDWVPVILEFGKKFTPHVGDNRNLKKGTELYDLYQKYVQSKNENDLLFFLNKHADFVFDYVNSMEEGSEIAHGISISKRQLLFRPDKNGNKELFVYEITNQALLLKIEKMKEIIRLKKITICFCPSTTIKSNSMENFSQLPIFEWIREGIMVKIGVDGMFQSPSPKTLSSEMVKLAWIQPKYYEKLSEEEVNNLVN